MPDDTFTINTQPYTCHLGGIVHCLGYICGLDLMQGESHRAGAKSAAKSRRWSGCPPPFARGQAFRRHDKALLGVVTPAKAGVHILYTQLKDFDGTLANHTVTVDPQQEVC